MMSYRFARRSFLSAIGGAVGLEILLRNMEASAQGAGPPPRFLMMHWPVGNIKAAFVPMGTGTTYTTSTTHGQPGYIISPFDTPELRPHTSIIYGLNCQFNCPGGGGHEAGTPFTTTGSDGPGTRQNGGEADDGCAGGPSWDQIFLSKVPALKKVDSAGMQVGRGFYNSICDSRIDSYETSTRCLSYSYTKQSIQSASGNGMISENKPLLPTLSPLTAFNDLFMGFMPGGGGGTDMNALRLLKQRKSVLDHSLRELERLRTLAPANERVKIDSHAQIIRQIETQLTDQINNPPTTGAGCTLPMAPPASLTGQKADRLSDYGTPTSNTDDSPVHEQVGNAHAGILRAAFACDLIRVATFQWSPGTNHVSFKGLDPARPDAIYMHHPLSHKQGNGTFYTGNRPTGAADLYIWDAMVSAQHWYFQKTAAIINTFRTQVDPLATDGGTLLERTVIPFVTEVGDASHTRQGHSALIFGGSKLGMIGGQFQTYNSQNTSQNRMWLAVAQAYLGANAETALASEAFRKPSGGPLPGLWRAPT